MKYVRERLNKRLEAVLDGLVRNGSITSTDKDNIINDNKNFLLPEYIEQYARAGFDLLKAKIKTEYEAIDFTDSQKRELNFSLKKYYRNKYFASDLPRCCFCGQLLELSYKTNDPDEEIYNISSIEHMFPKSTFPQYGLCINNWAPCCNECNSGEKNSDFFSVNAKSSFFAALEQLGLNKNFGKEPLKIWMSVSIDFSTHNGELTILGKKQCTQNAEAFKLISFYGIDKRYKIINKRLYNNLLNIIKHHSITSPEGLEGFLEACLSSNMNEIISDFSINNYPKLWQDFLDFILYDYNNLTALWEELKEYNKLTYFSCN